MLLSETFSLQENDYSVTSVLFNLFEMAFTIFLIIVQEIQVG